MTRNSTKLTMAMTIAVFTMMTVLVTMQTTHAFATFVQAGNQTGN